jgi:hypothetical protein
MTTRIVTVNELKVKMVVLMAELEEQDVPFSFISACVGA